MLYLSCHAYEKMIQGIIFEYLVTVLDGYDIW